MTDLDFSCPQDITSMPKTSCGFFCTGCKKEVIDFRNFSTESFQNHLAKTNEKMCGVFNTTQLNTPTKSAVSTIFRVSFALVFILGINTTQLFAQDTTKAIVPTTIVENKFFIQGQVFDEDSIPLPFVKVFVNSAEGIMATMTDFDGNYKLALPEKLIGQSIDLNVSFFGFEKKVIHFNNVQISNFILPFNFYLKETTAMLSVGIIVGHAPMIPRDPYEAGKTTINGEDIRRMP